MRFADPYLLALVLLIPLLLLLRRRFFPEAGNAGRFSDLALLAGYQPTWRLRYRWLPTGLRALALAMLVIALARPQVGRAESEISGRGIDIALVFDTSSSMTSNSLGDSTRLEAAQRVLKEFVAGRQNDRIGLVIFRSDSLVLSLLTLDYTALDRLIDGVDQINISDGTAIGTGLGDGLNLLRESRARSRVAILLTDGEQNAGSIEPLQAARIAETLGIRVYTIGVIEPRTRGGSTNVDERALQEMARVTSGRYFSADSEEALAGIYESIDALETSNIGRPQYSAYNELAGYFLVGALALLAAELVARTTVWRQAA